MFRKIDGPAQSCRAILAAMAKCPTIIFAYTYVHGRATVYPFDWNRYQSKVIERHI